MLSDSRHVAMPTQLTPRIALLEDDLMLRNEILLPGLRDYGFEVVGVGSAGELYRQMLKQRFDIVVLDIGLPDDSGLNVVGHLRELSSELGLVMLTGSRGRDDRIRALSDGADAFLSKPVDVEVLAATLHSLVRRLHGSVNRAPAPVPSATWHLDADGWCLIAPTGAVLALSVPERQLLRTLIDAAGKPVSRDALITALGGDVYNFDPHRLDMLVHRLRRRADDAGAEPLPLLTSRGAGYLFVSQPRT